MPHKHRVCAMLFPRLPFIVERLLFFVLFSDVFVEVVQFGSEECAVLFLWLGVIVTSVFSWFVIFSKMFSLFLLFFLVRSPMFL